MPKNTALTLQGFEQSALRLLMALREQANASQAAANGSLRAYVIQLLGSRNLDMQKYGISPDMTQFTLLPEQPQPQQQQPPMGQPSAGGTSPGVVPPPGPQAFVPPATVPAAATAPAALPPAQNYRRRRMRRKP
jgi:hypothetical protein